jgi:hypothetical protein
MGVAVDEAISVGSPKKGWASVGVDPFQEAVLCNGLLFRALLSFDE